MKFKGIIRCLISGLFFSATFGAVVASTTEAMMAGDHAYIDLDNFTTVAAMLRSGDAQQSEAAIQAARQANRTHHAQHRRSF